MVVLPNGVIITTLFKAKPKEEEEEEEGVEEDENH